MPTATKSCDFAAVIFLSAGHFSPFFSKKIRHFSNGTGTVCPADSSNAGERFKIKACKVHKSEETMVWLCRTGTVVKRISRVILFQSIQIKQFDFWSKQSMLRLFCFPNQPCHIYLRPKKSDAFILLLGFTILYFALSSGKFFQLFLKKTFTKRPPYSQLVKGSFFRGLLRGTLKTE